MAGQRLASDLRSIRRKKGVDLKEVLDATRLADDVIEQLEENGLVNHPAFNKVYLRSLYGAYGEAVGVRREDMITALDEVFDGHYVGSLARTYLGANLGEGHAPDGKDAPTMEDVDAVLTAASTVEDPDDPALAKPTSDDSSEKQPTFIDTEMDPEGDEDTAGQEDFDDSPEPKVRDEEEDAAADESADETSTPEDDGGEGETRKLVRPVVPETMSGESVWKGLPDKGRVLLPNMSGTALVAIAGVAFIALVWFAVSSIMDMRASEQEEVVPMDTTRTEEIFRPEPIVLPDSFRVDIVAFVEALDPIRITVDRDLRRPYWVEHMDTLPFVVADRIQLEREVENTRILVDGFAVPQDWLSDVPQVEVSRLRMQTWLDSLTSSGIVPQRDIAYR